MTARQGNAARLVLLVGFLAVWELLPRLGTVPPDLLPPVSEVASVLLDLFGRPGFVPDLATTLLEILTSFAIAVPLGAACGLLIAESPYAARVFDPLLFFLFSIPKSIFLPMFILTLGIGFWEKVGFGCFSSTLLVLLSTQAAVRSVRPEHLLVARSYGATRAQIVLRGYLPSMLPILLEALRLALIFTFTAVALADMIAATRPGRIDVCGLSHTYGGHSGTSQALANIDLVVEPGRFVVLVGPSGCGKTSLLMMLAGVRAYSSGAILCDGRPVTGPDPDRIGVIFQEANLFPWLTARDNVAFPLMLRHVGLAERRRRALDMLHLVGLHEFAGRYPHELSGGMRQRVSIARGLVQDPPVLLMDEPFAALDEQTRMAMGDELLRIWSETRKTVVFVTHSLTEAVYLTDEVLVMSARPGRIIDRIEVDLPRPRHYETTLTARFTALRERIWRHIRAEHA
jgi:NitT/TauT family transport system ATP-binding protein